MTDYYRKYKKYQEKYYKILGGAEASEGDNPSLPQERPDSENIKTISIPRQNHFLKVGKIGDKWYLLDENTEIPYQIIDGPYPDDDEITSSTCITFQDGKVVFTNSCRDLPDRTDHSYWDRPGDTKAAPR